ncbi:uncharacterized protein [Pyrus communis]|uniref:uncharacterized protein n=1 Tax=Pyrus communis TaxID=23211 RepID=UPI0035BF0AE5
MGLVLEILVNFRKIVMISHRACYRSVCNHPFLAGLLLFLLFLYRSFPFVFALLVSASPVLICTAVLLGTLLSFGQTNIPEIEREEKITCDDVASLRTRSLGDDTVVLERDGSFSAERFMGEARDVVDASVDKSSDVEDRDGLGVYMPLISEGLQNTDSKKRVNEDCDGSVVYMPLIDEDLLNTGGEKREIEDAERELESLDLGERRKIDNDHLGIEGIDWDVGTVNQQYNFFQKIRDEIRRVEGDHISPRGSGYAHEGDHLYSSLLGSGGGDGEAVEQQYTSFQKVRGEIHRVEDEDICPREVGYAHEGDHLYSSLLGNVGDDGAGEDVDDDASDSESDQAESSSPDASMADILPMLDELHPLLYSEAPQPARVSHDHEPDAASDQSKRNNAGSVESDVESENQGGEVAEDGNDYNDGDEEEAPGGKDDESKSAIKWTEDDQKNLMDLGNLELERNRRLENLIARRRARKSFKITAEKNLIDFDIVDLPFNVTPISTARHNPFDLYDPFDNLGLPIPGSAPSVMLPRRNPFDLPYESNEEKPDLKGDPFEQEFVPFHAKDAIFRRHESFSLGPSTLGQARQERQDFKWRPVFVPERLASEGPSSSLFQRQLSEVSESKLSSVPDTESVSSAADLDERKFNEQDFTKETEVISNIYHATDDLVVEHGSQSSEDVDSLEMEQAGKRDVQHDELEVKLLESQDLEPSLAGATGTHVEHITNEVHVKPDPIEEDNSSTSSLSSLTEEDEKIADAVEGGSTRLEARGDIAKEFVILPQPSLKESEVQFMSRTVNEEKHDEPVYDSTPLPTEKILSFNSISSDIQADISEMVTPPGLAEVQVPSVDRDSEVYGESRDKNTPGFVEISGATSKVHASDETERSLGTSNQVGLVGSHSEEDIYLPKIFDAKTADCSHQSVLSEEQPPSEHGKVLSWSDKSMVEPYVDHVEALIIKEEVGEVKEIDAGLLLELDAVGDFSVNEVIGEPFHTDELIPEEANVSSTEFGDLNPSELNQELPVLEARSIKDIKQIHMGLAGEEVVLPSVVDDQPEVEASENTVQTSSELPIVEARCLEDSELPTVEERCLEASENTVQTSSELPIVEASYLEDNVTGLKQDSNGNVNELPQVLEPEDGSTELPLEFNHTLLKQVSEHNNVGELSNGSEEVGTTAVDSTEEIASSNTVSSVQEDINADTALEQVLESHVDELPKVTSILNDGSVEVQSNAMGSAKEMASSNIVSSFQQENIITPKQVSDNHVNDGSEEVGTGAVSSTEEIASSNTVPSIQEDINADTALEQVSKSHGDELPKAASVSDDGLEEVGIGAISSTEEIASSNTVSSDQEDTNADTALEQVSESHVDELPRAMSISNDGLEGGTDAMGTAEEIASSNMLSSVHEDITPLKRVSEIHVHDGSEEVETGAKVEEIASSNIPSNVQGNITTPKKISESQFNDGAEEIGTNSMSSTEENASSDMLSSVQENSTLEQVSESHVDELLKPTSHLKEGLAEVGITAMASTVEKIASSTTEHGVQETITSPIAFEQVSGSNVDGEPPKPSDTQDRLAEVENIKHEN